MDGMEKRYILFDLDGTLTDSYEGIINAFKYSLSRFTAEPKPETFKKCIGPPVTESLKAFYGFDDETALKGLKYFREYYEKDGLYENRPYEGIREMLMTLRAHGKKLMVATSKPEHMAVKVLEHFGLAEYFLFIAGINSDVPVTPDDTAHRFSKTDVIKYVISENGIFDPENAVMVGDRASDIAAGKSLGLQTLGVSYGYGEPGELEAAGADYIAASPMEVTEAIIQS